MRGAAVRGLWTGAELVITLGVVLLLLVAHQLWWTNRQAREGAEHEVRALQRDWRQDRPQDPDGAGAGTAPDAAPDAAPDTTPDAPRDGRPARTGPSSAPRWDQAYAVLRIPRIGLTAPVAQGISKGGVLDKGYVGHYPRTAQPGRPGNFAVAGHRNTHGEPFRRIDRLRRGDRITVETREAVYTYTVDKSLARTTASDSGVIATVPRSNVRTSAGYSTPGYYLTLTTCTPEFTSRYRLIVWGRLTAMRPR
ncbi:class E sortase [Streptomyces sp. NBC_00654]|uniref:class E sortase n=1 Tax=Streptomyces sp. NBC_00654 TaxID=2975799 RepID=UPI00224D3C0F|nr:class E sortase [Streptomyces sp. NBC_00654]MCX4969575.1 class E sortase [Streptomyces sp. NBC_00654]